MPNRKLLNQVFTWLCVERDLTAASWIRCRINEETLGHLGSRERGFRSPRGTLLEGKDEFCRQIHLGVSERQNLAVTDPMASGVAGAA